MMRTSPPALRRPARLPRPGPTLLASVAVAALAACPGHASYPAPSSNTVEAVVARLAQARETTRSFRGSSVMDYWLGKDRVKGAMLVMGSVGAKVRFNALSPAGESVMADLACNGRDFVLVDFQNNCMLTGPCSRDSIAQLLRISLEPDDFLQLALGNTPVLEGATGTVTWDARLGHQVVDLASAQGSQHLEIDGRDGRWDVRFSELKDPSGAVVWRVAHTEFIDVKDAAGTPRRVPSKSRLEQPGQKADLLVEWDQQDVNPELDASRFELVPPAGLPECGAKKP
ncbi:MAG: hypothetical protein R3B48_15830 [Kofleriaceae bacterium]